MDTMNSTVADVCSTRVARFRALMNERGYDGVILRNNPDLRWLLGTERTFDFEIAHTAFITQDGLWLHTDSRYYNTFITKLGPNTSWVIDMDDINPADWAAQHAYQTRSHIVALEDTCDIAFLDSFVAFAHAHSISVDIPRMHGDIADLRMVKDQAEVDAMKHAQSITDAGFTHMLNFMKVGMSELELRVELDNYMLSHGADALAFDTITISGPNGANPHGQPSERKLQQGDMVVMDFGAAWHDYHTDMTRTVCMGAPSEEQQLVYDTVRRAQKTVEDSIMPGDLGSDMHNRALAIIAEQGYGDYFKHGLGHGVGLEIHERPYLRPQYTKPLPENSVVTVEPGIYLPGKFGVRIEDFGLVTAHGFELFTGSTHELMCL